MTRITECDKIPISDRVVIAREAHNLRGLLRKSPLSHSGGNIMDDKKFMTYEQQLSFLSEDKKLIVPDREKALSLLKQHSYFALINGYKFPFKRSDGTYRLNTKIDDIYHLYSFDNNLRFLLMQSIMEVEIHIKSLLSYAFCEKFGEDDSAYLSTTNYNYIPTYQQEINELVGKLSDILKGCQSFSYMKHQKDNHNNIPLWVMVKALTLGNISKMYSFQQPSIQTKISKEFKNVTEGDLGAFLNLLTRFRNVCAHNERLFDYRYNRFNINNMPIHKKLCLKKDNRYKQGKCDFFAALISLKYLLPDKRFDVLAIKVNEEIENLLQNTSQIQRSQLYKYMGLPKSWFDIKDISI